MFYLKTWICPNQTYFDPAQNLCSGCPIYNCLNCYNISVCSTCNETADYFYNATSMQCSPCTLQGCTDCINFTTCQACNLTDSYSLVNGVCQYCNNSLNIFINPSGQCQLCGIANCLQCASLTSCSQCNTGNSYYLATLPSSPSCSYCNSSLNMFIDLSGQCQQCQLSGCVICLNLF